MKHLRKLMRRTPDSQLASITQTPEKSPATTQHATIQALQTLRILLTASEQQIECINDHYDVNMFFNSGKEDASICQSDFPLKEMSLNDVFWVWSEDDTGEKVCIPLTKMHVSLATSTPVSSFSENALVVYVESTNGLLSIALLAIVLKYISSSDPVSLVRCGLKSLLKNVPFKPLVGKRSDFYKGPEDWIKKFEDDPSALLYMVPGMQETVLEHCGENSSSASSNVSSSSSSVTSGNGIANDIISKKKHCIEKYTLVDFLTIRPSKTNNWHAASHWTWKMCSVDSEEKQQQQQQQQLSQAVEQIEGVFDDNKGIESALDHFIQQIHEQWQEKLRYQGMFVVDGLYKQSSCRGTTPQVPPLQFYSLDSEHVFVRMRSRTQNGESWGAQFFQEDVTWQVRLSDGAICQIGVRGQRLGGCGTKTSTRGSRKGGGEREQQQQREQ